MSQAYTASNRTIHCWAMGGMANNMMFVPFYGLILAVYTTGFGMSPVLVGWAMMLPRILDALTDPLIGHLSDNTHTRWGRRRPYIFLSSVVGAMLVMALWWPSRTWPENWQFVHLLIVSILLFFCFGVFDTTHNALGYELSDDYNLRSKVVAVRGFYTSIASIFGGWIYWLALRPFFGGEIIGIRWVSVGMAALILVGGLAPVLFCRERFQNINRRHVNLWQAIRTTLRLRPFVLVLLLRFTQILGASLYGTMGFYIGAYSVCGGNKSQYTSLAGFIGIVGFAVSFALMPLAAKLSRSLGKRRGLILCFGAVFTGALSLPFLARPGHPELLFTYMAFVSVANITSAMFMASVMPDICDLDELESGERREGLFSAVMSLMTKIEGSLITLAGGYLVAFSGFNTKLAQQMIQQSPEVLTRLRLLGFTPLIVFSGAAFAISWFFPITQKLMDDVRARLDVRRAAGNTK
jgi:glycoside/pentoside/hexuronide:cation symporter, GPH family